MKSVREIRAEVRNFSFSDYFRHLRTVEESLKSLKLKPLQIAIKNCAEDHGRKPMGESAFEVL